MIRILTSTMGLGTYVPALLLADYLKGRQKDCQVQVIESYLGDEKLNKFLMNKEQYHQSFKVARLGHKLSEKKLSGLLEASEEAAVINEWDSEPAEAFLVMSGNWLDVLLRYLQLGRIEADSVYMIHMDVGITPSWFRFANLTVFPHLRVYDEEGVNYRFEYPELEKKDLFEDGAEEKPWIYLHGGGWGMGTYRECGQKLKESLPYRVRTTIHHMDEADFLEGWEYYLMDPEWRPWNSENGCLYPSIYRVCDAHRKIKIPNEHHQGMYSLYQNSCAIISKAGGGTLMDSLITATPLVFIDPIAKHEEENQKLWVKLGLGIRLEDWEKENYSLAVLKKLYENILDYRRKIPGIGESVLVGMTTEEYRENCADV